MLDFLNSVDTRFFLLLNGCYSPFFDTVMFWLSDRLIWIPLYLLVAFVIVKRYKLQGLFIILATGFVVLTCDQVASGLIKNIVHRLRPSHEPSLAGLVHLSPAGPGGLYGFVSSHAANTFGLVSFLWFVLGPEFKRMKWSLFIWAVAVSYSRIYNGVHYPADVICAAILGIFIGWTYSRIYDIIVLKYLSDSKEQ